MNEWMHIGSCSSRTSPPLLLPSTSQFSMLLVPVLQSPIPFSCTAPKVHSPVPFLTPTCAVTWFDFCGQEQEDILLCVLQEKIQQRRWWWWWSWLWCAVSTVSPWRIVARLHLVVFIWAQGYARIGVTVWFLPHPHPNYIPARYRLQGSGSDRYGNWFVLD